MPIGDPLAAGVRPRWQSAAPKAAQGVRTARRRRPALDESFDLHGLVRLRSAVAAYADALRAGPALDDILLTAYELCSNAVKHGGGSGRLRMWRQGRRIVCQVTDAGPGMVDPAGRGVESPPPYATGGRGLWIARRLADIHIASGPQGTTVTAAITVP
jgi:anti-sigma regulatory factor (Ser/Thr protein kinase)